MRVRAARTAESLIATRRPHATPSPTVADGGWAPSSRLRIADRAVSGRSPTVPALGVPGPGVTPTSCRMARPSRGYRGAVRAPSRPGRTEGFAGGGSRHGDVGLHRPDRRLHARYGDASR